MKVMCSDCETVTDVRLLIECNECEKGFCDHCIDECTNCGTQRCMNDTMLCQQDDCGNPLDCCAKVNDYHGGSVCAVCNMYLCREHLFLLTKEQKKYYRKIENRPNDIKTCAMWQLVFCKEHYDELKLL